MDYREIIKINIREGMKKKAKLSKKLEIEYWDWVIANLIADLRDYEGGERWAREPRDKLWERQAIRFKMPNSSIDAIFKKLLKDFFGEDDFWLEGF